MGNLSIEDFHTGLEFGIIFQLGHYFPFRTHFIRTGNLDFNIAAIICHNFSQQGQFFFCCLMGRYMGRF